MQWNAPFTPPPPCGQPKYYVGGYDWWSILTPIESTIFLKYYCQTSDFTGPPSPTKKIWMTLYQGGWLVGCLVGWLLYAGISRLPLSLAVQQTFPRTWPDQTRQYHTSPDQTRPDQTRKSRESRERRKSRNSKENGKSSKTLKSRINRKSCKNRKSSKRRKIGKKEN